MKSTATMRMLAAAMAMAGSLAPVPVEARREPPEPVDPETTRRIKKMMDQARKEASERDAFYLAKAAEKRRRKALKLRPSQPGGG